MSVAFYPFNLKLGLPTILGSSAAIFNPASLGTLAQRINAIPSGTSIADSARTGTARAIQPGRCYDFDGVDDRVDLGTQVALTGDFTICLWINPDAISASKLFTGSNSFFRLTNAGAQLIQINSTNYTGTTINVSTSEWSHIIVTRSGSTIEVFENLASGGTISASTDTFNIDDWGDSSYDGKMFDARIYSDVLTADEKKYVYTFGAEGTDPGVANLEGWYKMDEGKAISSYDSSGNSNTGAITNATLSTFHAEDGTLPYSYQDEVGYNQALEFDGVDDYIDTGVSASAYSSFTLTANIAITSTGSTQYIFDARQGSTANVMVYVHSSGALRARIGGSGDIALGTFDDGILREYVFSWDGSTFTLDVDGVEEHSSSVSQTLTAGTGTIKIFTNSAASTGFPPYLLESISFVGSGSDVFTYKANDISGTTITDSSSAGNDGTLEDFTSDYTFLYIPRDESDTGNDVRGNSLGFSGEVPHNGLLINSNCGTFDGVDDEITFSSLAGGTTITSYEGTATPTIDTGNNKITVTAGTLYNLVLSDGTHLPVAEGAGTGLYDVSGNDNHGTAASITEATFWGATQDTYHYNITEGFEEYDDDATGLVKLRVPYRDDGTQITPTISGYTKNQNNPAVAIHNDAETQIDFTNGVSNSPWANQAYLGHASYDGSTSVTAFNDIDLTGVFSISFKVYFNATTNEPVIGNDVGGSTNKIAAISNNWFIRVLSAGSSDSTVSVNSGQWYDVTVERDGSDKVDLIVDGSTTRLFGDVAQSGTSTWNALGAAGDHGDVLIKDVVISDNGTEVLNMTLRNGNALDSTSNNNHGANTDVIFPVYTIPTAYSFGDSFTPSGQTNHYKKEDSSVRESDFVLFKSGLNDTNDTEMTNQGYVN